MNCLIFFPALCQPGYQLLAVNAETEKIVGATDTELVGMDMKGNWFKYGKDP
mgnify:CR=1 FL=1